VLHLQGIKVWVDLARSYRLSGSILTVRLQGTPMPGTKGGASNGRLQHSMGQNNSPMMVRTPGGGGVTPVKKGVATDVKGSNRGEYTVCKSLALPCFPRLQLVRGRLCADWRHSAHPKKTWALQRLAWRRCLQTHQIRRARG
jgi:hypothetical protein